MFDEDDKATKDSLIRINKVCRYISTAMKFAFVVLCVWWLVSIGVMAFSIITPATTDNPNSVSFIGLGLYILYCLVIVAICIILIKIFSDAAKGESPFSMMQVRRLRLIALMLVFYTILEFAIACNSPFMIYDQLSRGGNMVIAINFAPLIAAAAVFAFSFVFKYGVLLQEFSDETL